MRGCGRIWGHAWLLLLLLMWLLWLLVGACLLSLTPLPAAAYKAWADGVIAGQHTAVSAAGWRPTADCQEGAWGMTLRLTLGLGWIRLFLQTRVLGCGQVQGGSLPGSSASASVPASTC